jgi:hypothetical protein
MQDIQDLIREELESVAAEYKIPPAMIPQLMDIMQKYPTLEGRGLKGDLVDDLEKIFKDAQNNGLIEGT